MRIAVLAASALSLALLVACGGGSGRPAPTATPGPSVLEVWQRVLAALDGVESVRATRSGLEYEGTASVIFPRYGQPSVQGYTPWTGRQPLPFFPSYGYTVPVSLTNMRLVRQEQLDGTPAWVVTFSGFDTGIDSTQFYDATAWVPQDTYLVRRIEYRITRIEGCCGEGPPSLPVTVKYSDYRTGSPATPTPEATETPPVASPPAFHIEPLSGPCDAELRLTGEGMQQNDRVSVNVSVRHISELGEVEGTRVPEAFAGESGRIELRFRPLEAWCASPEAAVERTVRIRLVVSLVDASGTYLPSFEYTIAPCATVPGLERDPGAFCFNTAVAAATPELE